MMAEWIVEAETLADIVNGRWIGGKKIVRCKDCKYYGRVDKRRFFRGNDCIKGIIGTIVPDKDYCSRAEKRE